VQEFQSYNFFTSKKNWDTISGEYNWDSNDAAQIVTIIKLELLTGFQEVIALEEDFPESLFYNYYSNYRDVRLKAMRVLMIVIGNHC
jgi:hypothetical protein